MRMVLKRVETQTYQVRSAALLALLELTIPALEAFLPLLALSALLELTIPTMEAQSLLFA